MIKVLINEVNNVLIELPLNFKKLLFHSLINRLSSLFLDLVRPRYFSCQKLSQQFRVKSQSLFNFLWNFLQTPSQVLHHVQVLYNVPKSHIFRLPRYEPIQGLLLAPKADLILKAKVRRKISNLARVLDCADLCEFLLEGAWGDGSLFGWRERGEELVTFFHL